MKLSSVGRPLIAGVSALALSALGVSMALPAAAASGEKPAESASLTWGVKESFRNYIYNFEMFEGKSSLLGNTVQDGDQGVFTWNDGAGNTSEDGVGTDVSFGADNGVHFQSHPMDDGYALDMQFTNPRVVVNSATEGELHLDVIGREYIDTTTVGPEFTLKDVTMATLELPEPESNGDTLTWTAAPATLTSDGADAFGGFYTPGEALDPVTFSVTAGATADPTTSHEVTEASEEDGLSVLVTGENYDSLPAASTGADAAGIYVGLRDTADSYDAINADTSMATAVEFVPNGEGGLSDGSFETTLHADVKALDQDAQYEVFTWVAHGNITDDTLVSAQELALTDADRAALFPGADDGDDDTDDSDDNDDSDQNTDDDQDGDDGDSDDSDDNDDDSNRDPNNGDSDKKNPDGSDKPKSGTKKESDPKTRDGAGNITCTIEEVPGKDGSAQLSWGVKSSFVSYVEGGIAQGKISPSSGASRTGSGFSWGSGTGTLDSNGQGELSFPGAVQFTGHDGLMDTTIASLKVKITGPNSGDLIANVSSQDMEGDPLPGGTVTFAKLKFSSLSKTGGTASVTLTAAGAESFAGFYSSGQAMDDLTVSFSEGTKPTTEEVCYDEDGNRVNPDGTPYQGSGPDGDLPRTGADGLEPLIGLGVLLPVLGASALMIRKRYTSSVK